MNMPTNRNDISNTKRNTIIANAIGKLWSPNKGYTQRPFSMYVSKKLESNQIFYYFKNNEYFFEKIL